MEQTHETLAAQIFELFDTGEEAVEFLSKHNIAENHYLLRDLERLCAALASGIESLLPQIELQNKLKEFGLNAPLTAARVLEALEAGDLECAGMRFTCSFAPLFRFWRRYTEFFLRHAADSESLRAWNEAERQRWRQIRKAPPPAEEREYRYDFSVIVLFYGHQEMTQKCLDSIMNYTKGHSYELITFDNGSDAKTTQWCESLPHKKKIYYPHNLGSSAAGNLIFTMAHSYVEGKYLLYISNDVIVTPRYDEILFRCMESDPRIAMAAPVCNSASNMQAIPVPYPNNDLAAMFSFARSYNRCDPQKWADRARLFQIIASYRPHILQQMELAYDPLFCYDMFADDDHSCALRRMGFRQVLCKDVFVHHYGSATLGEEQFQVMDLGRAQFYQKHGVDAWLSLGTELYSMVNSLNLRSTAPMRILSLNPLFGEGTLALYNRLRECGCKSVTVDALTEDARYMDDMEPLFHRSGLLPDEEQVLEGEYDIALVGNSLGRCGDLRAVLHTAAGRLKPGGLLLTHHENFLNLSTFYQMLQGEPPVNEVFHHDPQGDPILRVVTDDVLAALMEQAGMVLEKAVSLTNEAWKPAVEQVFSILSVQRVDEAKRRLMTSGRFSVWKKRL